MAIANFKHRGLRRLSRTGDRSRVPAKYALRLRRILTVLEDIGRVEDLMAFREWAPHELSGARKGVWSLRVAKNWRVTFRMDRAGEVTNVDLEDYH